MLYWNQGAGGVHAVAMNGRNIDHLNNVELIPPNEQDPVRLDRRLIQLLRDPRDEIFLAWTRSALDILDNPFLCSFAGDVVREWPRIDMGARS
jgi:hypothetical protein